MTTATQIRTADAIRWQREALQVMTDAITKGAKAKLEPLMWQLGANGCAGTVSTFGLTVAEQEQLFNDWVALLGLTVKLQRGERLSAWDNPRDVAPGVAGLSRICIGVNLYDWVAS